MNIRLMLLCLIICLVTACHSQDNRVKNVRGTATELNNKAINLSSKNMGDIDSIKKSLKLLDDAILIDSTYFNAYVNKISLLCTLGSYDELLTTMNRLIKLKGNNPQLSSSEAYILEK